MKPYLHFLLLILVCSLAGCESALPAPAAEGVASPEAVALSLATVDPEESLPLFEYDRQAPLDILEDHRWHEDNATWIDFTYASPKGGRVPARLVLPDGRGPFPGIILMHGGPGTLEDVVDLARTFTRYGAASIMITSPYRRPGGWEITQYMGNTWPIFTKRDLEIKIQTIIDLRRAIDILLGRPEIDPDRLAYLGLSWGGSMGGLLAGVEDRLVAYVLVVGDGGLVEHTADPGEDGLNIHFSENWAALMWPTEPLHFVGRAAPAALLFQNGLYDTYVLPHDAIRFQTAASEPKTIIWYEGGHGLPNRFVYDAAKWLQPYLGDHLFFMAPNYRPSARVIEWIIASCTLLMGGFFLWDATRRKAPGWVERLVWLSGIAFSGPIGLGLYLLTRRSVVDSSEPTPLIPFWKRVLGITTLSTVAMITGLFVGDKISNLLLNADFRLVYLQLYLTTLIVSWLISYLVRKSYQTSILVHILVMNLFWVSVMIFPAILRDLLSSVTWIRYLMEIIAGILVTYPFHFWLVNRRLECGYPLVDPEINRDRLGWKAAIPLMTLSYLAVFESMVIMVQLHTGLSWKIVIQFLLGVSP